MEDVLLLKIFKSAIDNLRLGVTITDLDRKIMYVNKSDAKMHGYEVEELIGKDAILYSVKDVPSKAEPNEIKNWEGMMREAKQKRRDGSIFPARLISSTIKNEEGNPKAIVTICEDITYRKKLENRLSIAKQLESFRVLTTGVAHDCNNIIGRLMNGIQITKNRFESDKNIAENLDFLEENTKQAKDILDSLFAYSGKKIAIKKANIKIESYLEERVNLELKDTNVKGKIVTESEIPEVPMDKAQMNQVIHNIVQNAIQAMDYKGKILVKAKCEEKKLDAEIPQGKYLKISIKDWGEGIKEENLNRIFDPLFTTKKEGKGVGLAFTKLIVDHHKGHITVNSEYGSSTVFNIYLPIDKNLQLKKSQDKVEIDEEKLGGNRILFVEDDEILVKTFQDLLEQYNIRVDCAKSGKDALKKYKKLKSLQLKYDILIIDLNLLGKMSGEKLLEKIRTIDPDVLAVATSGDQAHPVLREYEKYGFTGYLSKPFSYDEILTLLSKITD